MSTPGFGTRPGARGRTPGGSEIHGGGRGRAIVRLAGALAALPVAAAPAVLLAAPADSAQAAARPSAKTAYLMVTAVTTTPVRSDGRAAYIVAVRNIGPGVAKGTEVSSALGKGVTYAEGPRGTHAAGRTVTTQVGDVPAGTTVTVTSRVRVDVSAAAAATSAGTSSVRSATAPVRAPSLDAPPPLYHAAQARTATPTPGAPVEPRCIVCPPGQEATPTPSPSLLPAPAFPPAPSPGTGTPTPTVTATMTRTQSPPADQTPTPSPTATPSGTATPSDAVTPTEAVSATKNGTHGGTEADAPSTTPGVSSRPSPTATTTRTLYAAEPAASSPAVPAVPDLPGLARPPHDLALPPPKRALGPLSGPAPSVAPAPVRTVTAAPPLARPDPRAQSAPSARPNKPAAGPGISRRAMDLGAEIRDLLPFTGLPLALLAGAAGVLLIAGILTVRATRRRPRN